MKNTFGKMFGVVMALFVADVVLAWTFAFSSVTSIANAGSNAAIATTYAVAVDTHGYTPGTRTTDDVVLSATTDLSGAAIIEYSTDGVNWQMYTGDIIINTDTAPTGDAYFFRASNNAGATSDVVSTIVRHGLAE